MSDIYIQIGDKRVLAQGETLAYILESQKNMQAEDYAKAQAKAEAAEAKSALLDRLGITAEEAKLLLSQHNLYKLCLGNYREPQSNCASKSTTAIQSVRVRATELWEMLVIQPENRIIIPTSMAG